MDYLQYVEYDYSCFFRFSFKPCYKWITFNTFIRNSDGDIYLVLNLVINGLPSIHILQLNSEDCVHAMKF